MEEETMNKDEKSLLKGLAVFIGIIILFLILNPFVIVKAGKVGVVTRFGAVNRVLNPGIGMRIPLIESVSRMDTKTQKDQVDASAASSDLQIVNSKIAVNYHLDGSHATDVFQQIGTDYQEKVVSPAIQDTFKATTAQYTAEELITKRENVRTFAEQELATKLKKYNIVVDNFNIVNFDFSKEFNDAIEAKQVAQQQVETAKQTLAKIEVEADQARTQAKGQADAQALLRNNGALTPEYLQYLAITKWNGDMPTYWGGNALPFVNVGK